MISEAEVVELKRVVAKQAKEINKLRNRAICWEKAARNASNRYDRLKAAVEGLLDRYAQIQAEDMVVAANTKEFGHVFVQDAEATPGD